MVMDFGIKEGIISSINDAIKLDLHMDPDTVHKRKSI